MENFTPEIEKMLTDKLSLYKAFNALLSEERNHIVKMDIESIWKTTEEKKRLTLQIQKVREALLDMFTRINGETDMDVTAFSLSYLIRALQLTPEKKTGLRKLKLAIDRQKDDLARQALENKFYVKEYLSVIDDIMSVFVDNSSRSQYGQKGGMPATKSSNCLIHAKV